MERRFDRTNGGIKERQMYNLPISQWLGLRIPPQQDFGPLPPRYLLIRRS